MNTAGALLLVVGALFLVVAGMNASNMSNVSQLVGSFLPGLFFLIVGLKLVQKRKMPDARQGAMHDKQGPTDDPRISAGAPRRRSGSVDDEQVVADDPKLDIRRKDLDSGYDPALGLLLPVGLSGWAIAAGYLALFSVLCLPAPLALIMGILAVREIRRDPSKHGMGRAVFGIVMGGIGTVFVLLMLVAMLVEQLGK